MNLLSQDSWDSIFKKVPWPCHIHLSLSSSVDVSLGLVPMSLICLIRAFRLRTLFKSYFLSVTFVFQLWWTSSCFSKGHSFLFLPGLHNCCLFSGLSFLTSSLLDPHALHTLHFIGSFLVLSELLRSSFGYLFVSSSNGLVSLLRMLWPFVILNCNFLPVCLLC